VRGCQRPPRLDLSWLWTHFILESCAVLLEAGVKVSCGVAGAFLPAEVHEVRFVNLGRADVRPG